MKEWSSARLQAQRGLRPWDTVALSVQDGEIVISARKRLRQRVARMASSVIRLC